MAGWTVPGYTGTRVLGAGEAGRIVEAVDDVSGVRVAITYPGANLRSDEAFRERLRADAELLAGLEHPNMVRIRTLVETGTEVALITDAAEGAALRRVLAISGPLSPEAALAVMRGSLVGLGAAGEAGVVHRDYQPSNVVITPEGVVKVGGFGLAVRTEAMMPAAGTASYMAPELWEGAPPQSVTDTYAVTATFYECLTGRVPYAADSVFELQTMHRAAPIPMADVPAALGPLLALGLAKTPVERPADATVFLAELEAAAVVEYGLEWEERGRRELAEVVAGLPEEVPFVEAEPSVLPVMAATGRIDGDSAGMGRGTKVGIAAAAVAVIGAVVAAVALSPGKHAAAAAGPSGEVVSAPSDQTSPGNDGGPPGVPGAAPKPGASSAGSSSPGKATTGGPTTSTTAATGASVPGTTGTTLGLPLPTLSSLLPPSYLPTSGPLPTTGPTSPAGSSAPSSTPSATLTISASATMTRNAYSGPCPPTNPPTGTVTFTVGGLPAGGSVQITYRLHVLGGSGSGGSEVGSGQVTAQDGATTGQFTITDAQHSQKELSGTVEVSWTAQGTPGGSTTAGSVDIICSAGGGASSGGAPED